MDYVQERRYQLLLINLIWIKQKYTDFSAIQFEKITIKSVT